MECTYCKKILSNKYTLKNHQRTAKYCLSVRIEKPIDVKIYKCIDCTKPFTTQNNLNRHIKICTVKTASIYKDYKQALDDLDAMKIQYMDERKKSRSIQKQLSVKTDECMKACKKLSRLDTLVEISKRDKKEIDRLHTEIHILQNKLENTAIIGAKKPTTINTVNNIIQNLEPITQELLVEQSRHLTIEHVRKGPAGYAEYALAYPFKDRIVCVDYARRKAKYKDENGEIITDPKLAKLTRLLFQSIAEKNKELALEYSGTISKDLSIADQSQMIVDVLAAISDVGGSADGEDSDFHSRFAEKICSGTIPPKSDIE
jgi:hypothetical protein